MPEVSSSEIAVRQLREEELPAAEQIFREAFAAQFGLSSSADFAPGAELIGFRWRKDRAGVFAAERDGALLGTNVATRWGSVGIFGPLSVRPDAWNAGIGKRLVEAAVDWLEHVGCRDLVLYTLPQSPKHIALYQRYGYWPRSLTAITAKSLDGPGTTAADWIGFSRFPAADRGSHLISSFEVTEAVCAGLDLRSEVEALATQEAGETVMLAGKRGLDAFALCHSGPGSEATTGTAYVKFGAARPGKGAARRFDLLLAGCEEYAASRGATSIVVGVNMARIHAWQVLRRRGYRTAFLGVAMHRPNRPVYNRPAAYVVDDWR